MPKEFLVKALINDNTRIRIYVICEQCMQGGVFKLRQCDTKQPKDAYVHYDN